jgi:hypothetical protein
MGARYCLQKTQATTDFTDGTDRKEKAGIFSHPCYPYYYPPLSSHAEKILCGEFCGGGLFYLWLRLCRARQSVVDFLKIASCTILKSLLLWGAEREQNRNLSESTNAS